MTAVAMLQPLAQLSLFLGVGALIGRGPFWRTGGLLALMAGLVAALLQFLPGLPTQVVRPESFAWFAVAAVALGASFTRCTAWIAIETGSTIAACW